MEVSDEPPEGAIRGASDAHPDPARQCPPESSSLDDDPGTDSVPSTARPPKPWWEGHPDIEAMVARTEREIYGRPERPAIDYPDPVLADVFSGTSIRELRNARDDLERAKVRYGNSVRAARKVGLSWGQIGGILGVSRQQLHRRYRNLTDC